MELSQEQLYTNHKQTIDRAKLERKIVDDVSDMRMDALALARNSRGSQSRAAWRQADVIGENQKRNIERWTEASQHADESLDAAAAHYVANPGAYHEQAIKEAHAAGVEVNFAGDIARNVRRTN